MREMLTGFGVVPVRNERNIGLAAAQNQGAAAAIERFPSCAFLLFLDQDTEVGSGAVAALLEGYLEAAASHGAGAAGPRWSMSAPGCSTASM
jgi:GT2 family glycosyltransferase